MDGKQEGELVAADPAEIILAPDGLPRALREGGPPELYAHLASARTSVLGYVTQVIGDQVDGGGGDTEARSALDSLARKQGALTGG